MKTFFAMVALIITLLVALIITPNPKEPTVTRVTVTIPTTQEVDTLGCATGRIAAWCVYPVTRDATSIGAWIVSDHASYQSVGRRLRWMERELDEAASAARHERVREIFQIAMAAQAEACW